MSNKKIIFFDIDGTLLPEGQLQFTANIINCIECLKNNEIEVVIATGRSFEQAKPLMAMLKINTAILSDGQHIIINGVELPRQYFPAADRAEIYDFYQKFDLPIIIQTPHNYYLESHPKSAEISKIINSHTFPNPEIVADISLYNDILSFYIFGSNEDLEKVAANSKFNNAE